MANSKDAAELLFTKRHQLFLNFNDHTDQVKNSISYLNRALEEFVIPKAAQSNVNYLDVGCGFGNKTLSIIEILQKHNPVFTVALDPSPQLLSMFKEEITDQPIQLVCSSWENFYSAKKFDLISSIHTFYYMDNWQFAIHKMIDQLNKNGVICIALRALDPVCEFRDHFYKKIHTHDTKERNCHELTKLLDHLNINYKMDYVDSVLDIKDCLLRNDKGKQLVEFLLRQPYERLSSIEDEIIIYLDRIQTNGLISQRDGYIWISKQ